MQKPAGDMFKIQSTSIPSRALFISSSSGVFVDFHETSILARRLNLRYVRPKKT
jgi:hypothetical protein